MIAVVVVAIVAWAGGSNQLIAPVVVATIVVVVAWAGWQRQQVAIDVVAKKFMVTVSVAPISSWL